MERMTRIVILVLLCVTLASCGLAFRARQGVPAGATPTGDEGVANGEQIYFTGANARGNRIAYTGGPDFGGMMMGSYLTCASCHGPEARGGRHWMHMGIMDSPAIDYNGLVEMKVEDSGGTPQPDGYSLGDFRQAVVDGQDTAGDELDDDMPRWQMDDDDLADLFAFLQSID